MTDIDLKELRRLAEAATQGPWEAHDLRPQTYGIAWVSSPDVHKLATFDGTRRSDTHGFCLRMEDDENEKNAAYIAALNPSVVLALLDRLEQGAGKEPSA